MTNRTRLQVFKLAVDGKGINSGLCAAQIAKHLDLSRAAVGKHIDSLLSGGYIITVNGTRRPAFFTRGPKSNYLDKVCIEADVNPDVNFNGGSVNVNSTDVNPPLTPARPQKVDEITCRTHVNGAVEFQVLRQGDTHFLNINGEKVPLFDEKPYLNHNNVEAWKTTVPYDGFQVKIKFWHSKKDSSKDKMMVWPPEIMLMPEQYDDAEAIMITRAQHVVNRLAKYGGWEFGLVNFRGDIEFAFDDERMLSFLEQDFKGQINEDWWVDASKGKREMETKKPLTARMIVEVPARVDKIEGRVDDVTDRIYIWDMRMDQMMAFLEKVVKVMEKDAEVQALIAEKGVIATAQQVVVTKQDAEAQGVKAGPYEGDMFR